MPVTNVQLDSVPVMPRIRGHQRDFTVELDLADAAQDFAQNVALLLDLDLVGCMLIVAAAATGEVRTWRGHALAGRRQDFYQIRMDVFMHIHARGLAREHERRQDHTSGFAFWLVTAQACERFAAVHPLFDMDFV